MQWISNAWVRRFVILGRLRNLEFGVHHWARLADARQRTLENRRTARAGGDPRTQPTTAAPAFEEAPEVFLAFRLPAWRGISSEKI